MQQITVSFSFQTFPPLVLRGSHALILIRNAKGQFILGQKDLYPAGICRMLGGGIEANEDPTLAAARELEEETHLQVKPNELAKLGVVVANITDKKGGTVQFTTHLYFYDCGTQPVTAADDVDMLQYLSETELEKLIQAFRSLPSDIDPELGFSWSDYGQLNGLTHQVALDSVRTESL